MGSFKCIIQVLFLICFISIAYGRCNHGIIRKGVSQSDKNTIVQKHNRLRQSVANGIPGQPKATNMQNLEWDDRLAQEAQKIAETCEFNHKGVNDNRWGHVGQNLYMSMSTAMSYDFDWSGGIQSWFDEHKQYHYSTNIPTGTGHYTQVVWAETKYVGCGAVIFEDDDNWKYKKLYVCNYGPGGNIVGQYPYKT